MPTGSPYTASAFAAYLHAQRSGVLDRWRACTPRSTARTPAEQAALDALAPHLFDALLSALGTPDRSAMQAALHALVAQSSALSGMHLLAALRTTLVSVLRESAFAADAASEALVHGLLDDAACALVAEAERLDAQRRAAELARYESVFAHGQVAVALLEGPEFTFVYANAAYRKLVGDREVLGRTVALAMPELRDQGILDLLGNVYRSGVAFVTDELPVSLSRGPTGELESAYFSFSYTPYADAEGHTAGIAVLATEVTEVVREREAAHAKFAEYEAIFQSIPDAVYVGDASGIKTCNAQALVYMGVDEASSLGKPIPELLQNLSVRFADTGEEVTAASSGFIRALFGDPSSEELILRNVQDGVDRIVRANYAPIRVGNEIRGAVSVHSDITERKRLQAALEASELFKQRVIDSSTDGIQVLDAEARVVWMSESGLRALEAAEPAAALGRDFRAFWTPAYRAGAEEAIQAAQQGHTVRFVGEADTLLGNRRFWEVVLSPMLGGAGPQQLLAISRDISERKDFEDRQDRLLERERSAREDAERTNRMKDDFIATVSHELRTPLSAILGWARLLGAGQLEPAKHAHAVTVIERNAKVQAQLIEDLLDVSRIVSGKLRLDVTLVHPIDAIESALDIVSTTAQAKGVRVESILDPRAGPISGDLDRLQQVVWNLLTNAVKFTPKGGRVQVRLERAGSDVQIIVEDSGRGISAEFLPQIFEKFVQADTGATKKYHGLGLGLSIVKYLVEAHGGTIRATSAGVDRGATFVVTLPLSPVQRVEPAGDAGELRHDDHSKRASLPPVLERPAVLAGLRILVVDDEPDARSLLQTLLEGCRAIVTTAPDVDTAEREFLRVRPDVLVSDIGMAGQTGYDLIRRIRALSLDEGGRTPAVALTAYARSEDRMRALAAGFNMHIPKPIEPAELLMVIASLFARNAITPEAPD